jgi:hypothetical protein
MAFDEHTDTCGEVFARLSEYLNLELDPDACKEIENHLSGCAPCVEFLESLRKTLEVIRQYRPAELPEPLSTRAREQLLEAYRQMLAARKASC